MDGDGEDFGPNEFGEFDDWYNDGENCGEELQNQAASMDKATEEERQLRDEDAILGMDTMWGGELFVKFVNEAGKKYVKRASAHIIKAASDGSFIALTCRTNLHYKQPIGGEPLNAVEGYFFLQRTGAKEFAAVMKFDAGCISVYEQDWNHDLDHNLSAQNIAAIKFSEVKKSPGADLPDDIPALPTGVNADDMEDLQFTISGYPDQHINAAGEKENVKHTMYSITGRLSLTEGEVFGGDMLTSKGQNGGALTDAETGQVYGIYTGVGKHPDQAEKPLGLCVGLTPTVQKWIGQLD